MINIRQVANVKKDGVQYTLVDVKVLCEDQTVGRQVSASKMVNDQFTDVNLLFAAIQTNVVDVIQSGLL